MRSPAMKAHEQEHPSPVMVGTAAPDSVERDLRTQWEELARPAGPSVAFDPEMLSGLPSPVRRWLNHAIAPGTPLCRTAVFGQHGEIKLGRWQRYRADWVLAPQHGFLWAATTRLGPLMIRGFDRYTGGSGEMRWRLFGRVPFITEAGPDVTRSALGRLAGELCFVPAAALAPELRWDAVDDHQATAAITVDGYTSHVTLRVDDRGALTRIDVLRWGQPDGKAFGEHLFTALFDGSERTFGGFTIPVTARAGWWQCPDQCATEEFIRFTIDHARFR